MGSLLMSEIRAESGLALGAHDLFSEDPSQQVRPSDVLGLALGLVLARLGGRGHGWVGNCLFAGSRVRGKDTAVKDGMASWRREWRHGRGHAAERAAQALKADMQLGEQRVVRVAPAPEVLAAAIPGPVARRPPRPVSHQVARARFRTPEQPAAARFKWGVLLLGIAGVLASRRSTWAGIGWRSSRPLQIRKGRGTRR
jgi:hypothetical protein